MSGKEPREHIWRDRPSTTLKDVAHSVGVSESTASVILNGARSGTRVSADTRRAVLEAAKRLGYRPNAHARSLQTGFSNRIGIYSGRSRLDSRNAFFAELLGGVFEAAAEHGKNTVVHTSGGGLENLLDLVSNRAVDGIVVHPGPDDPLLAVLGELRVPAVAVADRFAALPSVCVDDRAGGALLAQHLAHQGHRHILIKQAWWPAPSAVDRMAAFTETAARLGMVTVHRQEDPSALDRMAADEIEMLTRPDDRITAIFAWCDGAAERMCRNLERIGLSIPGDVAIVGFDGFFSERQFRRELTTIRAPWSEVGRKAVSILSALIEGDSVPAVTTMPIEFIRGTTT
ncbi:MAG: LacI family DNA-binding transcriptional regulator [Fimbriimonas sp.]